MAASRTPSAENTGFQAPAVRLLLTVTACFSASWCGAQPTADGYRVAGRVVTQPQPVDGCQLLAKINGQVILSCEIDWQVNLRMEEFASRIPPEHRDQVRMQLTQQLLRESLDLRMLYADFLRGTQGMADMDAIRGSLDEPFEDSEVPRLMKVVGVEQRSDLNPRLQELGTNLQERKEDFIKSTVARQWIQQQLDFDKEVTHQQMLKYYYENTEKYDYPTQARWEELMVGYDRFPTEREAYAAICGMGTDALNQLNRAQSATDPVFESIARARSHGFTAAEGGQHDWTTKGALAAEKVDEAIFLTPVGQMSPIVRSDRGFHIVHVLERKQAGRTPFTEVQTEITKAIQDQRFEKAIGEKIAELKSKAHVWTVFTGDLRQKDEVAAEPNGAQQR